MPEIRLRPGLRRSAPDPAGGAHVVVVVVDVPYRGGSTMFREPWSFGYDSTNG